MKPNEEKPLGCNKNLGRGSCGDISFANKIILCDDCVWKLIEENQKLKKQIIIKNKIINDDTKQLIEEQKKIRRLRRGK